MRILLIEDEERLARNVARMLADVGNYAVDRAADGESGSALALERDYDLVILDVMLPGIDGLQVLRRLRAEGRAVPVLMLTARDSTGDIVKALDAGSDDYLTKPFEMAELRARVRALIRRAYARPDPVLAVGALRVNTLRRAVDVGGRRVELSAMEYAVLEHLAFRAGEVVSKEELLDHLYDLETERFSNVIEAYVSALRRKLGPGAIRTLRRRGYVLTGDVS